MMTALRITRPWIEMRFSAPCRVLGWTLNKPGFQSATRLLWREVRNADLPEEHDVCAWLAEELRAENAEDTPCFLTSRDVRAAIETKATCAGHSARCVATAGLSNAERIGTRVGYGGDGWGTINIALETNTPLSDAALIEALSIVTEARTLAVIEAGLLLPTGIATGTGTDCITVAAPPGTARFAGLHTALGEAIGKAAYDAMTRAVTDWMKESRHDP